MENGHSADDSTIPTWINSELLTEILSEDLNKDVIVTTFSAKRALPKGENYLSILYRVEVEYKENEASNDVEKFYMIIKSLPEGEIMQRVLSEIKGFEKEAYMYSHILPAMYQIIKSTKGKIHPLSAKRLTCSRDNIIVMEDLKHLGFEMAKRQEGLDLDHCKLTVKSIARFHAASLALYKKDPSFTERYVEGLYRNDMNSGKHIKTNMEALASVVETWEGYEKYAESLRKISLTALEKMVEIVMPKKDGFNVLNHGDCWVNNMLFRYNSETGKVEDIRLLDFQIARYSSPALDLQYFMCNCPNDEVRFQHRFTLLEVYYSELADYCKSMSLESELISFEQLKEEFEEKNFFGLITACTILCVIVAEQEDVPDFKNMKDDNSEDIGSSFAKNTVSRKKFREVFQKLLVFYNKKGLI
ncbi:hypothetical protein L9F63_026840 [Diploptera punctata]|uniref:CHK kinase-like domain-containing protein n=1 Tax=Diploptera punctata TaxID=6984 RepID=A0AAD7ZNX9_DIPPU|nr:hypothetical protein L9F63_021834 [Diploptera punctata]KAJ9598057.1 hypothetical protein L9F63_026840 [Diploptera punctata]